MMDYGISRNSIIILILRLCGGGLGTRNPNGTNSLKDVV